MTNTTHDATFFQPLGEPITQLLVQMVVVLCLVRIACLL